MRTFLFRLIAASVLAAGIASLVAAPADAHRNDESYIYLDIIEDDVRGNVQMPYPDIRQVLGLELVGTADDVRAELDANLGLLQTYAAERTTLGTDGVVWALTFSGFDVLVDEDVPENGLGYVILPFVVGLGGGDVPPMIDVEFTPFLDEIPDRNNIGLIANYWEGGYLGGEANELAVFTSDSPQGVIDLGNPSQWKNFRASMDLGIDHIRTGPDHIFFIFVLLLPSVLILVAGVWYPSPSFGRSLVRVLIVATMFTLAHSITFTLAGLDLVPLPPARFTESLIALSIAIAALHNLKPILGHREWIIAFVFGLFHGLGFAGFVEQLDISRSTKLVSLLGRNAGIEIGQAVIVLITFPALFLLSRTRVYRPFFVITTSLLAVISSVWVVERLFDQDFGLNRYVDAVVSWPRAFWLCVAVTALIAVFVWWENRKGRLVT
ncbi:MAG: HupE/UreJ family protein, partial [Ilumatobacteraceae bacterium]